MGPRPKVGPSLGQVKRVLQEKAIRVATGADDCEVVTAYQVRGRLFDKSRYRDVSGILGVLGYEHVADFKMELLKLLTGCRCSHEVHGWPDEVVLVDIRVIAEPNWEFVPPTLLVDVGDDYLGDIADAHSPPRFSHCAIPTRHAFCSP